VDDDEFNKDDAEESISGRSAALYFSKDSSIAQLLLSHGIKVRDFILVSFLSDQGPMTIHQLARTVSIEPDDLMKSLKRLGAAGLIIREPNSTDPDTESTARLTSRGQEIARKINEQL
jgi:DNA-binding MarR family transcriptional regulator